MIVVADTSPLNYLIRLGHANVLHKIYGRVLVPHAVLIEMRHPEAPAEVRAWASAPPPWLEERQVEQVDESLAAELGAGEREAITLALEVRADVLLIDERAGRKEAEGRHIRVAGTLAVLLQASLRGYFALPEAMKQLRQYGFRASPAVEALMLAGMSKAKARSPESGLGISVFSVAGFALGEIPSIPPRPDAAQASEAAVAFGQDDDITVVTLTRLATARARVMAGVRLSVAGLVGDRYYVP